MKTVFIMYISKCTFYDGFVMFSEPDFRYQQSFHGIDLASLRSAAVKEYFTQPIVVSNLHTCTCMS